MIRRAIPNDLEHIYSLYSAYLLDITRVADPTYAAIVQRDGFMLRVGINDKDDLLDRIQTNFLFNVYEVEGEIVGFININKEIYFPADADNIIWFYDELKKNYYSNDKSITLHEIVVDKAYTGKGIGKELLEDGFKILKEKKYTDIFSIVAFAPVTNCASIVFHTKNGFDRACVSMPYDLFGLQNYMSILFHKKITS